MRLGQIEVGGEGLGRKVLGGVAPRRFTGRTRCGGVTEEADGGRSSHVNDAPGRLLLVRLYQNHLGLLFKMPVPGSHPSPTKSAAPGTGICILRSTPPVITASTEV